MYTRERCFLLGLCLLGGVTFCLTAVDTEAQITATPDTNDKDIQRVQLLEAELQNDTTESRSAYTTKEVSAKTTNEIKKKPVMDFKARSDQKYQKPIVKDDDSRRPVNPDVPMTSSISPTTISMRTNQSSATTKIEDATDVTIPFLLHGAPIAAVTKATPMTNLRDMSNSTVKVTDKTTSSRGRALNISAPEPTNSLHANITDLSDVSMDEDDKEVEGGEYVAPHNETAISISSAEFSKKSECTYENYTYSIGEKIVRGCEEKCVCSENGITDCQPVCNDRFIKASEEIDKPYCRKHVTEEEPCCALLVCEPHSGNKKTDNETCMFGNKTVARKQRIEDGCSRICVCEDGGHLKCQPRCPPNETTTANQHDRCVTLASPSDPCCNITYCDVTLGDHEIKSENSTDLNVHLIDVKVLNSTAVKLQLSTKNPEDVVTEISQNSHVWSQRKIDKDGVISNLAPAHTYYIRVTEGSNTGPAIQVILPAEVMKTNVSEKTPDKNSCYYKGKSYKIGAEWYDDCVFYCVCLDNGSHVSNSCATIECPTDFGLDLLNPDCLDWETVDFDPKPPHCCPQEVQCRNNGSCNYKGVNYNNWSEIPANITGCENHCYCEMGNVKCQRACLPVPALPPSYLPCASDEATLTRNLNRSCCMEWTCNRSSSHGVNVTTAYPGPLATNIFDRQTIDNRLNNKSGTLKPSQEPEHSTFSLPEDPRTDKTQTDATVHGPPHYPMDPGYPTVPYSGPYNPDFISSHPTVENIFHLSPHTEKPTPTPKEKSKSKSDSKKPVEPVKPYKDAIDHFPGPFSPDRFPQKATSTLPRPVNENQHISNLLNTKKSQQKDHPTQLSSHSDAENIPPADFDEQLNNFTSEFSYQDSIPVKPDAIKPNIIVPTVPARKPTSNNPYVDMERPKPTPNRPAQDVQSTEQEILSDHLYHLINLQHPDSPIQLDHTLSQDHPSLYDQISSQKQPPNNRMPPGYFETPSSASKKTKPHIFAQKDENGQVTYHIHTPNIPHSPQQIEELLEYINQHHSKPGPFQHYPGQPAVTHNIPSGTPPRLPPHTDSQIPHSGFAHLNLPFAAQASNQSGQGHDNVYPGYPGNIPGFSAALPTDEITIQELEALDEHTVRVTFVIPQVFVGLHGRIELRYTSDRENHNLSTWRTQLYSLPNDLIERPHLEFELDNLQPSTEYKVKITVKLKNLTNSPTSKIYSVRTLDKLVNESILPPQIPVDTELQIVEVNSTWINVMWKKFTVYELEFIDGVQLRYKENDTHSKIYSTTPLIHRAVTNYVIENLKPSTTYEVGIYFIPFPGQATELWSEKTIEVTTSTEPDPYSFEVKVEIKTIKSTDVEVSWSGVPYPEDKYVNIYRAIYQSDTGKEDTSKFKIAKRDSHAKTLISDLKPGTRYRLWLEIYLTNGRIKKSNVQDFITKPGTVLAATVPQQAGKFTTLPLHEGDYYGPLVIVAIVASLAILSTLILLMMLMKRRTSSKADISPRKATSAYDNPSYKVELQQETMDL
ncbi:putative epidermal cell surface receptor isoform X2 [Linepithema humile]|uniref:putative epidermal cell surface receptor isoform X2 n=1 Tax=Linepithema humile TaxID=83485 RepID=UPI00351E5070